ncbi:hypothetical protein CERSUDRAFT_118451 [Gelatoporia subvermispora B]|uniref:Uncharacterized protein n=1 Tax=Ceriporiopsis subvermispora (strain B) TaxID=914234 RepID=M2Q770_CERS8|nr:hypothetical protein CERSUDRAFT_118451 [Gelatoporia subvermispora B]
MPTISSTSSSPSSSATNGNDNFDPAAPALTSSASLYLYTFLATLLLLLSVSAAIILRSYVIRRRARAAIAEAIANGTYIPPPAVIAATQPKPVLSDVWIDTKMMLEEERDEKEKMKEREMRIWQGGEWSRMMPVSATLIAPVMAQVRPAQATRTPAPRRSWRSRIRIPMGWYRALPPQPQESAPPVELQPVSYPHPPQTIPSLSAPAASSSSASPRPAVSSQSPSSTTDSSLSGSASMRVAVLIAMPSPEVPDPGSLPSVEFGIAQVPLGVAHAQEVLQSVSTSES